MVMALNNLSGIVDRSEATRFRIEDDVKNGFPFNGPPPKKNCRSPEATIANAFSRSNFFFREKLDFELVNQIFG